MSNSRFFCRADVVKITMRGRSPIRESRRLRSRSPASRCRDIAADADREILVLTNASPSVLSPLGLFARENCVLVRQLRLIGAHRRVTELEIIEAADDSAASCRAAIGEIGRRIGFRGDEGGEARA
jgi:hypothetical protein